MESQTIGEMKVQIFGDVAVVTGSNDEKSSYKAKDTSGHYVEERQDFLGMEVFMSAPGHTAHLDFLGVRRRTSAPPSSRG